MDGGGEATADDALPGEVLHQLTQGLGHGLGRGGLGGGDAMTLSDDQATFGIYHGALYPGASNINTKNHHAQHSP